MRQNGKLCFLCVSLVSMFLIIPFTAFLFSYSLSSRLVLTTHSSTKTSWVPISAPCGLCTSHLTNTTRQLRVNTRAHHGQSCHQLALSLDAQLLNNGSSDNLILGVPARFPQRQQPILDLASRGCAEVQNPRRGFAGFVLLSISNERAFPQQGLNADHVLVVSPHMHALQSYLQLQVGQARVPTRAFRPANASVRACVRTCGSKPWFRIVSYVLFCCM